MSRKVEFDRKGLLFKDWYAGSQRAANHRLTFDVKDGPQDIEFVLSDNAVNKGFAFDTADPIWAQEDTGECPPLQGLNKQIQVQNCDAKSLTIRHENEEKVRLRYQLNVGKDGSQKPIDPIMDNGGPTIDSQ